MEPTSATIIIFNLEEPCQHNIQYEATASSIDSDNLYKYGPQNAIDGIVVTTDGHGVVSNDPIFQSADDDAIPWLQIDFGCADTVSIVMITPGYTSVSNSNSAGTATLTVHVGTVPAKHGKLSENKVCATFSGEIAPRRFAILECQPELSGQYVIIQLKDRGSLARLVINEVIVFRALSSSSGAVTIFQYNGFSPQQHGLFFK